MHQSAMNRRRPDHSGGGGKGAHNRETLQTTGRTTRIVIVPREFAPIPHTPAGLLIPMAIRMRFLRHGGIYRSDVVQTKTKPWGGAVPPPAGRPRAQVKERVGRTTLFSSSAMSSGRLFLDRVARQHCPSPLHRHAQITTPPRPARRKQDISTLQGIGHFYFALTLRHPGLRHPDTLVCDTLAPWYRPQPPPTVNYGSSGSRCFCTLPIALRGNFSST